MKKIFTLLSFILFSLVMGGLAASHMGVSPMVTVPSVAGLVLFSSKYVVQDIYAYDSVDISAISKYAHKWQQTLITTLVNAMHISQDIAVIPNVKTSMKLPKLLVADGFRPYSATKEFLSGDLLYTDRELKVTVGKRELLIDPEDYRATYLSTILSPGSAATKAKQALIPFVQFIWNEVIKKVAAEINDKTAYFGFDKTDATVYSAAQIYDPSDPALTYITFAQNGVTQYFKALAITVAGESPDTTPAKWQNVTAEAVAIGLKKIIEDEIGTGDIVEVGTGAITDGPSAEAAFKELFRSMSPAYKADNIIIHASYTDTEFYTDGVEDRITKYTMYDVSDITKKGLIPLLGSNGRGWIKPTTWLGDSRRLIAEPMQGNMPKGSNLVMGTDLLSDANQILTKDELWTLEAGLKMVLGWEISNLDAIAVNDQE